jgi:hypothetical protein
LNDGFPRSVRIAAAVSVALAAAAVVALIEWKGARPQAAGDVREQPQSKAESSSGHPLAAERMPATARSDGKAAEHEHGPEGGQASTSPPSNAVAAGLPTPASQTRHPVAAPGAQHQATDQITQRHVDGVAAAKAIDWDKVGDFAPIPRSLPTGQAADAVDAGFVPEWFEHSIGRWTTRGAPIDGKVNAIEITPLASRIMSQSKSPEDVWAQGVESRLRSIIADNLSGNEQVISRVFCSSEGCLCYFEDTDPSQHMRPTQDVGRAVLSDPRSRADGITSQTFYVTGTRGWDLILISRNKPPAR